MNIVTKYQEINLSAWDSLVKCSSVRSWFQTSEAFRFFDSLSFMEAFVVAVTEEAQLKGVTVGYVQGEGKGLKKKLSRRAIIVGGPLLADDITETQLAAMLETVCKEISGKAIYIESRNFSDYSRWRGVFENCGFVYRPHLNFHLDTSNKETVDGHLSRTRKRHIHVALRDGATIGEANSEEDMDSFYSILCDLYRHKVKKPLLPKEFFTTLAQMPSARILVVRHEGRVIGGMAYVSLRGSVGYEWYVCGLDGQNKGLYPSELATYAGLLQAVADKCPKFDMMGAGTPDKDYGVRDFKALFGGTLVEHGRYLRVCRPLVYHMGKTVISLLEKQ